MQRGEAMEQGPEYVQPVKREGLKAPFLLLEKGRWTLAQQISCWEPQS